jgi:DNA-binding XRE family transcriptional regulator
MGLAFSFVGGIKGRITVASVVRSAQTYPDSLDWFLTNNSVGVRLKSHSRGNGQREGKHMTELKERSLARIAERLRKIREALGMNQAEFARRAGMSRNAYNAYEKARERPALDQALRLCDTYKLTLDWIYRGDDSGLRADLADAIRAITKARAA